MSAGLSNYVALFRLLGSHPGASPGGFQCMAEDVGHAEEQCRNAYPDCDVVWAWQGPAGVGIGPALADYYRYTELAPDGSAETRSVRPKCPHCGSERIRSVNQVVTTCSVTEWALDPDGKLTPESYGDDGKTWWDACTPAMVPYDCADCLKTITLDALQETLT